MNVGSRIIRAGFTNTSVLVSAVPSAGIGGPASCLGVRGSMGVVMGLAPAGQIRRRIRVAVGAMAATAGEHPIRQRHLAADSATFRTRRCWSLHRGQCAGTRGRKFGNVNRPMLTLVPDMPRLSPP